MPGSGSVSMCAARASDCYCSCQHSFARGAVTFNDTLPRSAVRSTLFTILLCVIICRAAISSNVRPAQRAARSRVAPSCHVRLPRGGGYRRLLSAADATPPVCACGGHAADNSYWAQPTPASYL